MKPRLPIVFFLALLALSVMATVRPVTLNKNQTCHPPQWRWVSFFQYGIMSYHQPSTLGGTGIGCATETKIVPVDLYVLTIATGALSYFQRKKKKEN